jgi:hypothetical protein
MARVSRKSLVKKGTSGKKAKKKSVKYTVQNVLVVSTIPFSGSNFETQFKAGLGTISGTYNANENQGYDPQTLETDVRNAGNATLVVTVGGLKAAQAALNVGTVPFISLAGGTAGFTDTTSRIFLGGICLDTYKHNIDRINYLMNKLTITADQICLLYNGNSAVSATEEQQFTYTQNADIDPTNVATANAIYTAAFDAIGQITDATGNSPGIQAIIVSADPFFTQTKEQLKFVASKYAYYMMYPLKEYRTGTPPKHAHSTTHTPNDDLPTVYRKMGVKAKNILGGQSATWDHQGLDNPVDH